MSILQRRCGCHGNLVCLRRRRQRLCSFLVMVISMSKGTAPALCQSSSMRLGRSRLHMQGQQTCTECFAFCLLKAITWNSPCPWAIMAWLLAAVANRSLQKQVGGSLSSGRSWLLGACVDRDYAMICLASSILDFARWAWRSARTPS